MYNFVFGWCDTAMVIVQGSLVLQDMCRIWNEEDKVAEQYWAEKDMARKILNIVDSKGMMKYNFVESTSLKGKVV